MFLNVPKMTWDQILRRAINYKEYYKKHDNGFSQIGQPSSVVFCNFPTATIKGVSESSYSSFTKKKAQNRIEFNQVELKFELNNTRLIIFASLIELT